MEQYDILVAGAGVAGLCAAIQAGRGGARTLLVEKNGIPGGTLTMADVPVPGLFDAWSKQVISGIGWELIAKALDAEGVVHPDFSRKMSSRHFLYQINVNPMLFAAVSDQELLAADVEIAYHTMIGRAVWEGASWCMTLCGKDGLYDVSSKMLIDCTGDANLTHIAGYQTRESEHCQPGTSSVRLLNVKPEQLDTKELAAAYSAAVAAGEIKFSDLGWGEASVKQGAFQFLNRNGNNANHVCDINAADSKRRTAMEIEGRQALYRAYRFLKGHKGMENLGLQMTALECGVRETRTIVGEYTMTGDDYASGKPFDDAVCYSFYPIDIHLSTGLDCRQLKEGIVPQVPMRIMIPQSSTNFLAAGRIVSSDQAANSALRIQATCMATGQAAAANALCALSAGCLPVNVPVAQVKNLLRQHEAIVP